MQARLIVAIAIAGLAGAAQAQTAGSTAREAVRDTGAAAKAAVTPGDQNMGRTPENRSGGVMGTDRTNMNTGTMGTTNDAAGTPGQRPARPDRG